jgi:phospho-N-acetylmuramoyl-pentapeptide-transferase
MLYHLLAPLGSEYIFFNLFNYITFRFAGGMATAILLSFLFGPSIIRGLRRLRMGQVIRTEVRRLTSAKPARRPWAEC